MPNRSNFRLQGIACYIALAISGGSIDTWTDDSIQFDPRFLELRGDTKIDLGKFSKGGYVDADKYNLHIFIDKQPLSGEYDINWYVPESDPTKSYVCLTPELVTALGLKGGVAKNLQWTHNDEYLRPGQLDGMEAESDLSQSALLSTVPQTYLEYTSNDWDPPSRWDGGIPDLIADYSLNAQTRHQEQGDEDSHDIGGNGIVGTNLEAWRFRADWQSDYQYTRSDDDDDDSSNSTTNKNWDWNRYYAWQVLPSLKTKLSLGEDYLNPDTFDGSNYIGSSVSTDDQILPPNLRGHTPDVPGMAHGSVEATISQVGRVPYETQVPAGSFRIRDTGDSVSGILHVCIEEQNGQVQEYDVTTVSMPFLVRQGQTRYKVMMGHPKDRSHKTEGGFLSGEEALWRGADGRSFYGGTLADKHYQSAAVGVGRDLVQFDALTFDMTHSHVNPDHDSTYSKGRPDSNSFRVSYAKDFDKLNNRVTFADYCFSERNFMTVSEYLDTNQSDMARADNDKETYTITYNQNFAVVGVSIYLNYSHRTCWDRPERTNYNLMFPHCFNMGSIRNMSISATGRRYEYDGSVDKEMYLSMNIPRSDSSTVTYNDSYGSGSNSSQVGYPERVDDATHYQTSAGINEQHGDVDDYLSHDGSLTKVGFSVNYHEGEYCSAGIALQSEVALTAHGGALHRTQNMDGARLLVSAGGIVNVPAESDGAPMYINIFGKMVVAGINNYYRSQAYVDLNNLSEDVEATQSVAQATLTEGVIGYRRFKTISGREAMAVLGLHDGSYPPFGVGVENNEQQQVSIVDDGGDVYLAGANTGEYMTMPWEGSAQCETVLPKPLLADLFSGLLLPCEQKGTATPGSSASETKPIIQDQTRQVIPTEASTSISAIQ